MKHGAEWFRRPLIGKDQRDFVYRVDVFGSNDATHVDVAEEGDLFFHFVGQRPLGAAEEHIGLNTDGAQFLDAVLSGLGLEFLRGGDPGN